MGFVSSCEPLSRQMSHPLGIVWVIKSRLEWIVDIKGGWQHLIGRRIEAVVTVPGDENCSLAQIHLVLEGEVNFEIFSSSGDIGGASMMHEGDLPDVLGYGDGGRAVVVFGDRRVVPR